MVEKLDLFFFFLIFETISNLVKDRNYSYDKLLEIADWAGIIYAADSIVISRPGKKIVLEIQSPYGISAIELIKQIIGADEAYITSQVAEINSIKKVNERNDAIVTFVRKYTLSATEDKDLLVSDNLISFVCGELSDLETPYFKIGEKWYRSEEDFVSELNDEFKSIYGRIRFDFPFPKKWDEDQNENKFLEELAFASNRQYFVFHKIIPKDSPFELCDIIHWDKENIYLIHVKPSFDGAVRVLEKQITHSSKFISEDLRGDFKYLKSFFNKAKSYSGKSVYFKQIAKSLAAETEEKFLEKFKTKSINYVACIVDNSGRSLDKVEEFDSMIAKMSIIEAYKAIRQNATHNSMFRISQIQIGK